MIGCDTMENGHVPSGKKCKSMRVRKELLDKEDVCYQLEPFSAVFHRAECLAAGLGGKRAVPITNSVKPDSIRYSYKLLLYRILIT